MRNHNNRGEKNERRIPKEDLTELILGPLSDQIEKTKWDILGAIQKVNESVEIIARELAKQIEQSD